MMHGAATYKASPTGKGHDIHVFLKKGPPRVCVALWASDEFGCAGEAMFATANALLSHRGEE